MTNDFTGWRTSSLSFSNGQCVEVGIKAASWRKSARSAANGECVEVASWRKSARSIGNECIEVGHGPAMVGVRDTKLTDSPVLTFPAASWRRFLGEVRRDG